MGCISTATVVIGGRWRTASFTCAVIFALICLGRAGAAQTDAAVRSSEAEGRFAELLEELDAADYATREAATRALMDHSDLTREIWERMLRAAATPERRHRLIAVGVHLAVRQRIGPWLSDRDNGALGIHHAGVPADQNMHTGEPAVRVIRTEPGFPAHAVLRPGDLILAIDEQPFPDHADSQAVAQELVRMIVGRKCGQTVRLTIWRDGQRQEAPLTLSSTPALRQAIEAGMAAEAETAIFQILAEVAAGGPPLVAPLPAQPDPPLMSTDRP